jgi:hypothetical protein
MHLGTDRSAAQASLLASTVIMLAMLSAGSAHAQARLVAPLGPHTVGAKLSDVRAYSKTEDCHLDQKSTDCTFVSPEGIEYVVQGSSVTLASAREKSIHGSVMLPFGLKFGDSLATALAKLVAQGKRWTLGPPEDGPQDQIFLGSEEAYPGENGATFVVEVYFDRDRLVRVDYDADDGD